MKYHQFPSHNIVHVIIKDYSQINNARLPFGIWIFRSVIYQVVLTLACLWQAGNIVFDRMFGLYDNKRLVATACGDLVEGRILVSTTRKAHLICGIKWSVKVIASVNVWFMYFPRQNTLMAMTYLIMECRYTNKINYEIQLTQLHGRLTRYVKVCVVHAPGMTGTFSPLST